MVLDQRLADELEFVPDLKAEVESRRKSDLDIRFPKPEANEVQSIIDRLLRDEASCFAQINKGRESRYLHDSLPDKWQKNLQDGRRFYSRLSHNEILRVVGIQTRNPYKFRVPPRGATKKARDRAQKQTRWANQFFPAMERKTGKGLRRIAVDGQNGDGRSAWLVYLTDSYDNLDLEKKQYESDTEYMARTDEDLMGARTPFGLRALDRLQFVLEEDEDGVAVGILREEKPTNAVWNEIRHRFGEDEYEKRGLPGMGVPGSSPDYQPLNKSSETVECTHYWDRRWHVYIVDNKVIDGPEEHGLPGVPIIPIDGITTSSKDRAEQFQGITWGMTSLELATNDLLTRELDTAFTYQRPRLAIEQTRPDGVIRGSQEKPYRLNLQDEGIPELLPGQKIVNLFQGWEPYSVDSILNQLQVFWQRSGLNPISTGESPGADPAGYTVNTLMGAAQNLYEINLDNEARAAGQVIDFIRLLIRDVIRQPVYLSAPMSDKSAGGTEWLGLGPEDIDETPVETSIDPLSDVNRLALQAALRQGNKEGYVPRSEVQVKGYGADDPDMWDREMVIEAAMNQLTLMAIEEAKMRIYGRQEQDGPVLNTGDGQTREATMPKGSTPAATNAPALGGEMASASQGGSVSGQNNGYTPPGEPSG